MCDNLWEVSKQISPEREEAVALGRSLRSCVVTESRDSHFCSGKNRSANAEQQENLLPSGMSKHLIGSDPHCRSWSLRHSIPLADPSSFLNQKDDCREVVSCDTSAIISREGSMPLEKDFNSSDLQQQDILEEEEVLASSQWNISNKDVSDMGQQKTNVPDLSQQNGETGEFPDLGQHDGEKGEFPVFSQQNGKKEDFPDLVLSSSQVQNSRCLEVLQADVQGTDNSTCTTSSTCLQVKGNPEVTQLSNILRTKAKKRTHCFPGDSKLEEFPPRKRLKGKSIISNCYRRKRKRKLGKGERRFKMSSCKVGVCVSKGEMLDGFRDLYKSHLVWFRKLKFMRIPRLTFKEYVDLVQVESLGAIAFTKCITDSDDELPLGVLYESISKDTPVQSEAWLAQNLSLSPLYTEGKKACWKKIYLNSVRKEEAHWHGILYLRKLMAKLSSSPVVARKIVKFFMSQQKQSPRQIMGKICQALEIPFIWEIEEFVSCIMQDLNNKGYIECDMCSTEMKGSKKIVKTSRKSVLPLSSTPHKTSQSHGTGLPDQPLSSKDHSVSVEEVKAEKLTPTETVNLMLLKSMENIESQHESTPDTPEKATSPFAALSSWWVNGIEVQDEKSHETTASLKKVRLSAREGKRYESLKEKFVPHEVFGSLMTLNHNQDGAMNMSPDHEEYHEASALPRGTSAGEGSSHRISKKVKYCGKKGKSKKHLKAGDEFLSHKTFGTSGISSNSTEDAIVSMSQDSQESPKPSTSKMNKRRLPSGKLIPRNNLGEQCMKPLLIGWVRELVHRGVNSTVRADVYYHPPTGKKLRSMVEISKYLSENHITDLTIENFSYSKNPLGCGPPREIIRNANLYSGFRKVCKKEEEAKNPTKKTKPKKQSGSKVIQKVAKKSTSESPSLNDSWSDDTPITNEVGETTGFEDWIDKGQAIQDPLEICKIETAEDFLETENDQTAKDLPVINKDHIAKDPQEKNAETVIPGSLQLLSKHNLTRKVPQKAAKYGTNTRSSYNWLGIVMQYEQRKLLKDTWHSFESTAVEGIANPPSAYVLHSLKNVNTQKIGPSISHIQSDGSSLSPTLLNNASDTLMEPSSGTSMGRIRVKNLAKLVDSSGSSTPPVKIDNQITQTTVGQDAGKSTVSTTNATDNNVSYMTSSGSNSFNTPQSSTTQLHMPERVSRSSIKVFVPKTMQNKEGLQLLLKPHNKGDGTVNIPLGQVTPTTSKVGFDVQNINNLSGSTPRGKLKSFRILRRPLTTSPPATGTSQEGLPGTQPSASVGGFAPDSKLQKILVKSQPVADAANITIIKTSTAQPSVPVTTTPPSLPGNNSSLAASVGQPVSECLQAPQPSAQPNLNLGFYRER